MEKLNQAVINAIDVMVTPSTRLSASKMRTALEAFSNVILAQAHEEALKLINRTSVHDTEPPAAAELDEEPPTLRSSKCLQLQEENTKLREENVRYVNEINVLRLKLKDKQRSSENIDRGR